MCIYPGRGKGRWELKWTVNSGPATHTCHHSILTKTLWKNMTQYVLQMLIQSSVSLSNFWTNFDRKVQWLSSSVILVPNSLFHSKKLPSCGHICKEIIHFVAKRLPYSLVGGKQWEKRMASGAWSWNLLTCWRVAATTY